MPDEVMDIVGEAKAILRFVKEELNCDAEEIDGADDDEPEAIAS